MHKTGSISLQNQRHANICDRFFFATGAKYIEILEESFLPSNDALIGPDNEDDEEEEFWMVQDNCPVHKSHAVRPWFEAHPRIHLLYRRV